MKFVRGVLTLAALVTCCGNAFCADLPPPDLPSHEVAETRGSIPCPQCGVWAISEANEVAGPHNQNIRDLDGPVGSYIFVDNEQLTIPFCGSFLYTVKSFAIESEETHQTFRYVMALRKINEESLLCKADRWTLDLRISAGAVDPASQADFTLTTDDGTPTRQFHVWNIARSDPSQSDGTPGIGQVTVFRIAKAITALSHAAVATYGWYINEKSKPFDVPKFAQKVRTYCERYFSDLSYNPSIAAQMRTCEYMVLEAKYNEFVTFKCDIKNGLRSCQLPTEALVSRQSDKKSVPRN